MPFPFTATETVVTIPCQPADLPRMIDAVETALKGQKGSALSRSSHGLTFRGGLLRFVSGWNQLAAIGSGKLDFALSEGRVSITCRLSFVQFLVATAVIVALVFGVLVKPGIGFLAFAWLWIFGGNYLIARYRFPRFIRAAADSALRG